jgi:hypothetical protein
MSISLRCLDVLSLDVFLHRALSSMRGASAPVTIANGPGSATAARRPDCIDI